MSAVSLSAITDVLVKRFDDDITWQINHSTPLFQFLPVKGNTGQNIQWPVRFGTDTGAVYTEGSAVSTFHSHTKKAAILSYASYYEAFSLNAPAVNSAWNSGNPAALVDLFAEELGEASARLSKVLGQDVYDGDGVTTEIAGLVGGGAITDSGTYAGLARGTFSQWAGTVLTDGSNRPLSFELMRDMRRAIYIASGLKPDLIVCNPAQHEKYGLLFGDKRRYVQEVKMRGQTIALDGGYMALEFDGIPVIEDINAPANKMLFLNTSQMFMRFQSQANPVASRANASEVDIMGTPEEQFGPARAMLKAKLQPLAITGDFYPFGLFVYPQLQVKRPQSCGYLDALEE